MSDITSDYKHRMSLAIPQSLDKVVKYVKGDKASTAKNTCAFVFEPLTAFADMGLTLILGEDNV